MYFVFLSCSSLERGVYAPNLRLKRCDALRGGHERIPELNSHRLHLQALHAMQCMHLAKTAKGRSCRCALGCNRAGMGASMIGTFALPTRRCESPYQRTDS